jgi:hypothetical protein
VPRCAPPAKFAEGYHGAKYVKSAYRQALDKVVDPAHAEQRIAAAAA